MSDHPRSADPRSATPEDQDEVGSPAEGAEGTPARGFLGRLLDAFSADGGDGETPPTEAG